MTDPLRNPNDPLLKSGPEAEQQLFRAMAQVSEGFPIETVLNAAINMILNAVRQSHDTRAKAETFWDTIMGRAKALLLDQHYDNLGKRRNVFPFDQRIDVPHINFKQKY